MIKTYYTCNHNSERAYEMYLDEYPKKKTLFEKLDWNLTEFGTFEKPRNKYRNRIQENESYLR